MKGRMIERRLPHIDETRATPYSFLVALVLAYPCVALMRFLQAFDPQRPAPLAWWVYWVVVPVVFALLGAFLTALFCSAYNLCARLLGRVRFKDRT